MPDIKKLLRRNRFFLEILGIVVAGEFADMQMLDYWVPSLSALHVNLMDAMVLTLMVAPFIFWRSRAVHGREAQNLSEAVQHSSTAVLLLDTAGRIYWANAGFTQMSGYTLDEAIGLTPAEMLGSGQSSVLALETLAVGLARREPCRVIVCNRCKNGSHYFVDIDFRPDYDKHGKLVGFIEIGTDVTELTRARQALEASLRESEALRHTVNTHAIVSVADHAGRILDANAAFCAISGYSCEQLLGQDHRILNSGTHAPEFWAAMWDDISHGKPWRGEICNRNSQGQLYWVDSMIAPFLGADGLVEKYVSVRVDITSRKAAEAALDNQTRLLAEVVESAPYGLAVYDEQQVLRLHNAQFLQTLDLPAELLEEKPFYLSDQIRFMHARGDYADGRSFDAVLADMSSAMATRLPRILERRQFDGRHIEMHARPISGAWTVLSYRDNTERKNQQLTLNEAQERVRLATESAGIGIWSLNPITGEQRWDAQQYRLFGLEVDTKAPDRIYDLWARHLHPEDAEAARDAFQQTLNNGTPFDLVFRIIRPDGAVRYIKALGSPRVGAGGRVEYIFGTNMDVTDVTLLAAAMQEARDRAEEAVLTKNQFMTNMSHEIRTPMNAVLGMLKLLGRSELNTLQRNYIDNAERASHMMMGLIDGILEYAKLSSGEVLLLPKAFRLEEVLQSLSNLVQNHTGSKEVDVLFDLDPQLPAWLFGDQQRLQQVLVNLLGNAIKFTLSGEVVCRIHLQAQEGHGSRLAFCIRDTGIGIAPESTQRIFQSFTQLQATTTRAYGGVGLGLRISQRLVELMGGSIVLESEVGMGSSFSFALDLALPDEDATQPVAGPAQAVPQAALVVDDCRTALDLICSMAEGLHWHSAGAATGAQALARVRSGLAAQAQPFRLILLDWNLQGTDVAELVQQIRSLYRQAQQAQPRIILLSNNANPAYHQRLLAMADLVDAGLAKPFTAGMLQAVLQRAQSKAPSAAVAQRPQRLEGLRVLAVDDVSINQTVIKELLKSEGALVSLASNGRLAVDAVLLAQAGQAFDLVLMDIQMPVMDGYEATRLIRSVPQLAQLPIIAVTANVLESDRALCLAAGMNHHVGKPYDLDELVAVIRSYTGLQHGAAQDAPALPQVHTAPLSQDLVTAQPMHVYWIRATAQQALPDAAALLQQGVLLRVLESLDGLAELLESGAPAGLLVMDQTTATSAALRALGRSRNGASMKAMLMIALADAATEEEMRASRRAGAVDVLPQQFALHHLPDMGKRYLDAQGKPRLDVSRNIAAIDSPAAMAHMQADAMFFGSLLRAFFDELPGRKTQFQEDWGCNGQQIQHHSHALKGLARTLGLHHLAEVAVQTETRARQGDALDTALLGQLEGELQSAGFQILRWLQLHKDVAGVQA